MAHYELPKGRPSEKPNEPLLQYTQVFEKEGTKTIWTWDKTKSKNNSYLDPKNIITTLGSKGAYYNGMFYSQPNPQQTIDVSGAGDTFVAAFAVKFLETLEEGVSIDFANEMAGRVVSQRGVVTP